jgi:cyanophycinase
MFTPGQKNTKTRILVAVGGNEDKENDLDVLQNIVALTRKEEPDIQVITTASSIPEEVGKQYIDAFSKIGVTSVTLNHIQDRKQADDPKYIKRMNGADLVFFTGGDQLRLTSIFGASKVLEAILTRHMEDGLMVGGTSAGASVMSETMIYEGQSDEALCKGGVQLTAGFGLVENVVIDSHFIKRGRFSRLMDIVTTNPSTIGLGLGEDTGVVIRNGRILEAIGNGLIVIFDGQNIRYTNIADIEIGEGIAVENVAVHTLVKSHGYDLITRTYLDPQHIGADHDEDSGNPGP